MLAALLAPPMAPARPSPDAVKKYNYLSFGIKQNFAVGG